MTYANQVTDPDERLLNRFWRVLYALRSGPLRTTSDFPVPSCHQEVKQAVNEGFISVVEGYQLTEKGRTALDAELSKRKRRVEEKGYDPKAEADKKRRLTGMWKYHHQTREEKALILATDLILYALKDESARSLKEIAKRVKLNSSSVGRSMHWNLHHKYVEETTEGYVLTPAGRTKMEEEIKRGWPSDEAWEAELQERALLDERMDRAVHTEEVNDSDARAVLKKFDKLH